VSYYAGDTKAVDQFLADFSDVFIPKVIGVSEGDDFIDSNDADYVMGRIRQEYLGDSTVTLCMIGTCTHSRRYVDWELKTTLRRGSYTPNGLVGILLPHMGNIGHLPPRFKENFQPNENDCYAIYRSYPSSKELLRGWIEEAFRRRTEKADLIVNSQEMLKYNRACNVHNVTH
jgi:hypothetical protein